MKTLLTCAAMAVASCTPATAQNIPCAPVERGAEILQETYQEVLVFSAVLPSGHLIEVWANGETGTWSLVENDGDLRCLLSSGDDHQYTPMGVDA